MNNLVFQQVISLASMTRGFPTLHYYTPTRLLTSPYLKHKQMQKGDKKGVR